MRPLQHQCPTLRGDKDDKERRQTITCQKFHPNTGYLFHLVYAYITQGRPDRGLLRLTPRAQAIITQGIGVYAAPLLQPTQITARTAQGNPIYVYHPTAIARLPIPSDTDIIYFTDASGTQQRTPTVGCASVRITRHAEGLHVEHHTGATIFGASCHGPAPQHPGSRGRHGQHPPHQAPCRPAPAHGTRVRPHHTSVGTIDGLQGHAPPGRPTHSQTGVTLLRIGQWMRRHAGQTPEHQPHPRARTRATGHPTPQAPAAPAPDTPGHTAPRMDARGHAVHRSRQAVPLPHTHPATGHYTGPPSEHRTPPTPLYYSALRPDSLPAHLQKPRLQLALEQLPLLTQYHRWYARRSIHVRAGYTKCICGHAEEETWDHFKVCPLYRGLDTLTDWNPTHTIAQHAGWLTQSPATQQLDTVLKQKEVLEAVRRGLVPTAVYTLLRTHAEDPQATAAHMQRTAVAKTAEQLTYRTHKYLQHAATLPQTDQAHLLKLLFYQP